MMNVREWINNNSAAATIVAVVALVVALAFLVMTNTGRGGAKVRTKQWFYDLDTKQLFEVALDEIPPIDTTSGKEKGVLAVVYSCTDCSSDPKIAWLEKFPAESRQKMLEHREQQKQATGSDRPAPPIAMMDPLRMGLGLGKQISSPDTIKWVAMESEAGNKIRQGIQGVCGEGGKLKYCYPDH